MHLIFYKLINTSFELEVTLCFDAIISCLFDSLETTRHVSLITITLSKKELDTSSPGLVRSSLSPLFHVCWRSFVHMISSPTNNSFELFLLFMTV
jgi:hypothetical protein